MLEKELNDYLKILGASLIGFADLSDIDGSLRNNLNYGVSFAVKLNSKVIEGINKGATKEYYEEYNKINCILDNIAMSCVKYINNHGYNAIGQT